VRQPRAQQGVDGGSSVLGHDDSCRSTETRRARQAGFRFGSKLWFEPAASVSCMHSDFDDFGNASGNFVFSDQNVFSDHDGVRGRGGARIGFTSVIGAAMMTRYGGGN